MFEQSLTHVPQSVDLAGRISAANVIASSFFSAALLCRKSGKSLDMSFNHTSRHTFFKPNP